MDSYVTSRLPEPAHSLMSRVRALYLHGSMDWLAAVERIRDELNIHHMHVVEWNSMLWTAAFQEYNINIWGVEKKKGRREVARLMDIVIQKLLDKKSPTP